MLNSALISIALLASASAPAPEKREAAPAQPPTAQASQPDSGDPRVEDIVYIQGIRLVSAHGKPLDAIRVGAFKDGEAKIIPAQIDERDPEGLWVYKTGADATEDVDKGLVDSNDEMVFMAKDAGEATQPWSHWPEAQAIDEIIVTDPLTREKRYAYMLRYKEADDAPEIDGDIDYASYDPEEDTIEGERYIVGFPSPPKVSYQTYIIKKEAGGSGENLFDRFKMRLFVSTMWGLISILIDESDMESRLSGYNDGPVRVQRKVVHWMNLLFGLGTSEVIGESYYYATTFQFPSQVEIPFEMDYVLSDFYLYTPTDFNENALGMKFYSDKNPKGVDVDGKMSEEEKNMDMSTVDWMVVSGPQGAWMNRLTYRTEIPFVKNLYYNDDKDHAEDVETEREYGPENFPGEIGCSGYSFGDLHKTQEGVYKFTSHIYAPVGYKPGDETRYINMTDHPLDAVLIAAPKPIGENDREDEKDDDPEEDD